MLKKLMFAVLCIMLVAIVVSCSESGTNKGSLRIILDKGSRTIAPDSSLISVDSYSIEVTEPTGKVRSVGTTYHSNYVFPGTYAGTWLVEVYGLNSKQVPISYGSETVEISGNEDHTVRVTLDRLYGSGSFSLTFKWDTETASGLILKVYMQSQDSTIQKSTIATIETDKFNGETTVTQLNIDAGSYIIEAVLEDSQGVSYGGITKVVRVTNEETTSGTIDITGKTNEEGNLGFEFIDQTSIPLEAEITGISDVVQTLSEITATLSITTQDVDIADVTVAWYLDGKFIGNGITITAIPQYDGDHSIDAAFSLDVPGSLGSTSKSFISTYNSSLYAPYKLTTLDGIDSDNKFGDNIAAYILPNGILAVASNTNTTLYLIKLNSYGKIDAYNYYPYESIGIDSSERIIDLCTAADSETSTFTLYAFSENTPAIHAFRCSSEFSLSEITTKKDMTAISGNKITILGPATAVADSTGVYSYVAVAAASSDYADIGLLLLRAEVDTAETDPILLNTVFSYSGEGSVFRHVEADSKTDTITLISADSATVYSLSIFEGTPGLTPSHVVSYDLSTYEQGLNNMHNLYWGRHFVPYSSDYSYGLIFGGAIRNTTLKHSDPARGYIIANYGSLSEKQSDLIKAARGTLKGDVIYALSGSQKKLVAFTVDRNETISSNFNPTTSSGFKDAAVLGSLPIDATLYNAVTVSENGRLGAVFSRGIAGSGKIGVFNIIKY